MDEGREPAEELHVKMICGKDKLPRQFVYTNGMPNICGLLIFCLFFQCHHGLAFYTVVVVVVLEARGT